MKDIKIAMALSGGIDSSYALYLLKKKYKDNIIAIFMKNWDPQVNEINFLTNDYNCTWKNDYNDAKKICEMLDVPLKLENFETSYREKVFTPFIKKYKKGLTPNPDILCNKYIKFDNFKKIAKKKYNCNYIATGHYAKIINNDDGINLYIAKDKAKDQTYFLSLINRNNLKNVIFPLCDLTKTYIKKNAKKLNFLNWNKNESMGICFIGERKFDIFLKNFIDIHQGKIINFLTNKIVGIHDGIEFYTLNQSRHLNLYKTHIKYSVYKKDIKNNILYVVPYDSKLLYNKKFYVNKINFINNNYHISKHKTIKCNVKLRHSEKQYKAQLYLEKNMIILDSETKLITPGQYCVFYINDECIGGAEIKKIIYDKKN